MKGLKNIEDITFASPVMLLFLFLIPALVLWFFYYRKEDEAKLNMPSVEAIFTHRNWIEKLKPVLVLLRLLALFFLIIALARPRIANEVRQVNFNKGVDIMMAVDISGSMDEKDLIPSRLQALKKIAIHFARERKLDRIGLVAYAGEAFTKVPLTTDRDILIRMIRNLNTKELEAGTAIGNGLGTAVNHLKNSKAKSKIIILLTDGVNNSGFLDPEIAAQIAADNAIRVYTIGVGSNQLKNQSTPVDGLDENLLKKIALKTKGRYFRATSAENLAHIYSEIDQLEKSDIKAVKYYTYQEFFRIFLLFAFILIVIELTLRLTLYRSFI